MWRCVAASQLFLVVLFTSGCTSFNSQRLTPNATIVSTEQVRVSVTSDGTAYLIEYPLKDCQSEHIETIKILLGAKAFSGSK
jgi:hypothetical protein